MKTRILYFILFLTFISQGLFAQQEKPVHYNQVGITFSNLNSFGLNYKTGGEKTLFRVTFLTLNLGKISEWGRPEDSVDIKHQSYGAGLRLGFEKRVPVYKHLDFIWGLETGCDFGYQKEKRDNFESVLWNITPLIALILGVNYTLGDHLVFGAEITPGIQYSYGITDITRNGQSTKLTTSAIGFVFTNNSASLSIAYRFGK